MSRRGEERRAPAPRRRPLAVALGVALAAALVLSSMRLEIFRLRYALGEALSEEEALLERRRALEVEVARLRDPLRLRALAEERGFALPERVIRLDPGTTGDGAPAAPPGEDRP